MRQLVKALKSQINKITMINSVLVRDWSIGPLPFGTLLINFIQPSLHWGKICHDAVALDWISSEPVSQKIDCSSFAALRHTPTFSHSSAHLNPQILSTKSQFPPPHPPYPIVQSVGQLSYN